jgi:hypothetical protein
MHFARWTEPGSAGTVAEQCSMVELLNHTKKQQLAAFLRPAFHTQFIVGPMNSK